jgi:hypothetical protein
MPFPPAPGQLTVPGGKILIVQYPGPLTGERPIYAGRFNMEKRKAVEEERLIFEASGHWLSPEIMPFRSGFCAGRLQS